MYCSLFVLLTLGSNKDIVRTRYVCWKWSHAVLLWRHKLSFIKCWLHLRLVYFKEVLMSAHTAIDSNRYKIFEAHLLLYLDKKSWYSVFICIRLYCKTKDEIYSIRLCNWITCMYEWQILNVYFISCSKKHQITYGLCHTLLPRTKDYTHRIY